MVELVMEPTNKPRLSDAVSTPAEQERLSGQPTPQELKLNLLVSGLATRERAMGPAYWKKTLKG